jgi:Domain of unknown function (DUF892)
LIATLPPGSHGTPSRRRLCANGIFKETSMANETKKLDELFHDTLKDIFYAEKKILTALPKMAKAAQNPDLKAAFEKHETETEEQV